ncbi:MAG: carboxymuconolactone decarboxylase family protein [Aequorivita sp.]
MIKDFPKHYDQLVVLMEQLGSKIPETMQGFGSLHKASIAGGALDAKTKELIALGIAITVRCDGCIAFHVHDALESGATTSEINETIGVAILMGGGPSVIYGCEALEALNQFMGLKKNRHIL